MRGLRGRERRAGASVAVAVAGAAGLLVGITPGGVSAAGPPARSLPVQAKGLLGTLDTTGAAARKLVFDTSAGRYSLDGVKSDVDDRRAIRMADGRTTPVFDFDALRLGPSTVVRVRGKNPLVLVSKRDVSIATPLRLDGKPGADNGRGAGGGGGGGGGAVAIFAKGTLTVSSLISVDGGPGGVGNAAWKPIHGGDGGAGGVTLASATKVELLGTISALTGGKTRGVHGPVVVAGPVAYGPTATVNGLLATKASALQTAASVAKGTLAIDGGSGGGGGGGTGLPEVVTADYVKTMSAGGLGGPGGLPGGAGGYAVAGGKGGEGGRGLYTGGGGGGGGAFGGPGGARGGGVAPGQPGSPGGSGGCPAGPASAVAGGTGGAGGSHSSGIGGAGGTGGSAGGGPNASGTAGSNGGTGSGTAGGGGGGGGGDGCGTGTTGDGGRGGNGGSASWSGRSGSPGTGKSPPSTTTTSTTTTLPITTTTSSTTTTTALAPPLSGSGVSINDASGLDFDAACVIDDPTKLTPPGDNNIKSPGDAGGALPGGTFNGGTFTRGDGCDGVSTYDGSSESTDFNRVALGTTGVDNPGPSDDQLVATWTVDSALPAAGSTCNPQVGGADCADLPDNTFVGVGLKAMFQVPARQNNTPTNPAGGGCPRIPTGQVFDQHEHWIDGNHHFIGFDVQWNGTKWVHSAQVGTYGAAPDAAFFFTELGVNDGSGWSTADPAAAFGTNWKVHYGPGFEVSVTVDGVLASSDAINCSNGVFYTVYFKDFDVIANVKGLSTADNKVTLPATVPLSIVPGLRDITAIGGFSSFSDITHGNSTNSGLVGGTVEDLSVGIRRGVSYTGGFLDVSDNLGTDTLGDSPACPTETFGDTLPSNPLHNPSVGCQYDDDNIPVPGPTPGGPWTAVNPGERGTLLAEWWDTIYSFTA